MGAAFDVARVAGWLALRVITIHQRVGRVGDVRSYGLCPECGHDWREHPPHVSEQMCSECRYEFDHGQRETDAPGCQRLAPGTPSR